MFSAMANQKSIESQQHMRLLVLLLIPMVIFMVAITANDGWAKERNSPDSEDYEKAEQSFADADVYFELNNTDGDLGIHALIDGDAWKHLEIEDPKERKMLNISVQGRLKRQGLTELFFESAEPTFDELPPRKFFRRFPEGIYEISGMTIEGEEMESEAEITHLMPAPPANIMVNGVEISEGCDEEERPVVSPNDSGQIVVSWDPVETSHPELGRRNEPIEVVQYQVVVEAEELELVFNVELPPDLTVVEIPAEFIELGEEFKLEILVREESGNQTAVETCFAVE